MGRPMKTVYSGSRKSGPEIGTREWSHVQPAQGEGNQEIFLEKVRILETAKAYRSPQKADSVFSYILRGH